MGNFWRSHWAERVTESRGKEAVVRNLATWLQNQEDWRAIRCRQVVHSSDGGWYRHKRPGNRTDKNKRMEQETGGRYKAIERRTWKRSNWPPWQNEINQTSSNQVVERGGKTVDARNQARSRDQRTIQGIVWKELWRLAGAECCCSPSSYEWSTLQNNET